VSISSNDSNLINSCTRSSPLHYTVVQYLNKASSTLHTLLQLEGTDLKVFLKKLKQQKYYLKFFYISFNVVDFFSIEFKRPISSSSKIGT